MKKVIKTLVIALVLLGPASVASASSFNLKTSSIYKIPDVDLTRFNIQTENVINPQDIAYWKVRFYCDRDMLLKLEASGGSVCGKAVRLDSLKYDSYSFLLENHTYVIKKFSTKLKAYDQNGKWLHTAKNNFSWK